MTGGSAEDCKAVALLFTKDLAARDYDAAYALTSRTYRGSTSVNAMQAAFEGIVPTDWGTVDPIEIGLTMEDWPGKESSDVGWVFVSVGGGRYIRRRRVEDSDGGVRKALMPRHL